METNAAQSPFIRNLGKVSVLPAIPSTWHALRTPHTFPYDCIVCTGNQRIHRWRAPARFARRSFSHRSSNVPWIITPSSDTVAATVVSSFLCLSASLFDLLALIFGVSILSRYSLQFLYSILNLNLKNGCPNRSWNSRTHGR